MNLVGHFARRLHSKFEDLSHLAVGWDRGIFNVIYMCINLLALIKTHKAHFPLFDTYVVKMQKRKENICIQGWTLQKKRRNEMEEGSEGNEGKVVKGISRGCGIFSKKYTLFFFFTLFYFTILYWFCHTLTWIHHEYMRETGRQKDGERGWSKRALEERREVSP